MADKSYKKY